MTKRTKFIGTHMPIDLLRRARCEALRRGIPFQQLVAEALDAIVPKTIKLHIDKSERSRVVDIS